MEKYVKQPHHWGFGLFGLAAGVLLATLGSNLMGWHALVQILMQIAQPLCAAAISTLTYLAIVTRKVEKSQAEAEPS